MTRRLAVALQSSPTIHHYARCPQLPSSVPHTRNRHRMRHFLLATYQLGIGRDHRCDRCYPDQQELSFFDWPLLLRSRTLQSNLAHVASYDRRVSRAISAKAMTCDGSCKYDNTTFFEEAITIRQSNFMMQPVEETRNPTNGNC